MTDPVRVLVVDDSAFARKVLREVLSRSSRVEVVGIARDGLEALEKIAELKPDVITLDLVMPNLDGLGLLSALRDQPDAPRVIVVSSVGQESELAVAALQSGAIDLVHKPTSLASDQLYELGAELVEKVLVAASARPRPSPPPMPAPLTAPRVATHAQQIVVIGASTGGPQALTRLLSALPADFPAMVCVVLHIPPGYTEAFARRVNDSSAIEVVEAHQGLGLRPAQAVIARAGLHLKLTRNGDECRALLDVRPLEKPHRPSVDVLFESAAIAYGPRVVAVVLTGMGDDGLAGARAVRAAGGVVITEAQSSCVVYGMPRCVREAGLAQFEAPIDAMAEEIMKRLR